MTGCMFERVLIQIIIMSVGWNRYVAVYRSGVIDIVAGIDLIYGRYNL